jgi:competence protein ComEA
VFTTWRLPETVLISVNLIAMWKQFVKDYLRFTRKDRVGVLVLVSLIFFVILLPYIWPVKKPMPVSREEIEKIKLQVAGLNKQANKSSVATYPEAASLPYLNHIRKTHDTGDYKLFYFDPNTLSAASWQQLGIKEKTASTIVKYVSRGGKFRQPQDIGKIYGLNPKDYARLLPFVKIAPLPAVEEKQPADKKIFTGNEKLAYSVKKMMAPSFIDINRADTAAFIALPGIGSKLAARIVAFREKLGGFYSVQQVAETYGLPDSTFTKIQSSLQCNLPAVRQIDINASDANTLKQHPYIRWNLANAIVQYRTQHGNFKSVDDLQQIALMTPEVFERLKIYLAVQ